MQYGRSASRTWAAMVNLIGSADQQMATQAGGGMSATPQGVEAQQAMVDITTNNYQKAIESFFSHYCSYALTIYFQELQGCEEGGTDSGGADEAAPCRAGDRARSTRTAPSTWTSRSSLSSTGSG